MMRRVFRMRYNIEILISSMRDYFDDTMIHSVSMRFLSSYPPFSIVLSDKIIRFGIPKRSASPAFCPNPIVRSSMRTVAHNDSREIASLLAASR